MILWHFSIELKFLKFQVVHVYLKITVSFSLSLKLYFWCKANVFQNAMRATMEHYADKGVYPPIQVHVTLGKEDLTVKVSVFFF